MLLGLDYPSQSFRVQCAPEPMLLDTCAIQHLETVTSMLYDEECYLDDEAAELLLARFGTRLGAELIALANLATLFQRNGPPWAVSETSLVELGRLGGERGLVLRRQWWGWHDYWGGWSEAYPEIEHDGLMWPRTIVSPDQLALFEVEPTMPLETATGEPFDAFRDAGDRALVRDATRAGIPAILTTDIRSFWTKRRALYGYGLEVWRPSDVWRSYGDRSVAAAA